MLKIALIEAGHWHVPLYLHGLAAPDVEIVAVADSQNSAGPSLAERYGARFYESYVDLLQGEAIDFAFAFGRPSEMPRIAEHLLAARVPFALEKPCATNLDDLKQLQASAEAANAFVAVPYIYRVGMLRDAFRDVEGQLPGDFKHLSFRFIGGPPQRYVTSGCGWMLDPQYSGGGSTINLGGHFVDLFRLLTGEDVATVCAVMSNATYAEAIEDYSVMTLRGSRAAVAVVETGYTFPGDAEAPREFTFSARSDQHYFCSSAKGMEVREVGAPLTGARELMVELNNDHYYALFVRDTLDRFRRGVPPACVLTEAVAVMQVIEAAYRSARENGRPIALG